MQMSTLNKKFYAGIGSRSTPLDILNMMTSIAKIMEGGDWILRSGGAKGADLAFEKGVEDDSHKEIFYSNDIIYNTYNNAEEAKELALKYHPSPNAIKYQTYVHALMARDGYQVLGSDLKTYSSLIICWTPKGKVEGGTGQALRIGMRKGIPILNLGDDNIYHTINEALQSNTLLTLVDLYSK